MGKRIPLVLWTILAVAMIKAGNAPDRSLTIILLEIGGVMLLLYIGAITGRLTLPSPTPKGDA